MNKLSNPLMVLAATLASAQFAAAETLNPAFDATGRLSSAPATISKTNATNLAVGPLPGGDYFRTYLTFDLTSATTATGDTTLTLKAGTGAENNTSSVPQVFTLFLVAGDWDGATHPGPTGTTLATANFTPAGSGNDTQNVTFTSAALTTAFNDALGGNLHLGIRSDAEGTDARSFKWFGKLEDTTASYRPELTYIPPDPTPPAIVPPTVPANGDSGVLVSTSLVAIFDEPILLEDGGTITIDDLGAGPDTVITLPDSRVEIVGNTDLVITPDPPLATSTSYAIQISNDAVKDLASPANFFPGISDTTTWNFQTAADGTPPGLVSTTPVDEASDVSPGSNLVVVFDENIMAGSGNIRIRNLSTGKAIVIPVGDPQVSIPGDNTLTINPDTDLGWADDYVIRIDAGAIKDTTGNSFPGILDDVTWNFTVAGGKVLAAFDDRCETTPPYDILDKTRTTDMGIGPISSGRYFRSYLTFDLSSASAATGETTLVLSPSGSEGNTSAVEQTFTLFVLGADWDGTTFPGPDGTAVATATFTPAIGNDNRGISFTSAALTTAFNNALGGSLHLGIKSDQEGTDARSFLFLASLEDAGLEPRLNYTVASGGETFATWITGKPGVNGQTAVGDDPDADGNDNGVENFFGTEPGVFSTGLVAGTLNPGAGTFTFIHPQGSLASDLTATYHWSTDLVAFHPNGASSGGTTVIFSTLPNPPAAGIPTTVTATVSGAVPVQKLFMRVEVTQN